ncbi:MAG: glycosyltransferase family 4 protein [Elusimicrobiota bacterium]
MSTRGGGMTGVVMLTPNFHPYVGGAEKQALELSKALSALGVRVQVLTRRVRGLRTEDEVSGIPVYRAFACGGGLVNAVTFLFSSFIYLLRRSAAYDVIHVHLAGSPAVAACLAGRLLGKRVVVKVGGGRGIGEIAMSRRTPAGRLKLLLLRRMKPRFVAVTEDLRREMMEFGFTDAVRVVPNGVDIGRYRPARADEKSALRADLEWPAGTCFLYVGRLAAEKQLDFFLRAFAAAMGGCAERAFCVFAGGGGEQARLRDVARAQGIADAVLFVPPTDRIERLYAAADVFVLPSVSEGLSNALLEAMAAGLPILGSRVGGTREVVKDGEAGTLFAVDDFDGLRRAVVRYVKGPGFAAEQGRIARREAEQKYSLASVAKRYLEIYH